MRSYREYFSNVYAAITGKESFATTDVVVDTSSLYIVLGVVLLVTILYSAGAARLSWCYNISIGNSKSEAFIWSIICFFFSGIYYPFYALLLNPVCNKK